MKKMFNGMTKFQSSLHQLVLNLGPTSCGKLAKELGTTATAIALSAGKLAERHKLRVYTEKDALNRPVVMVAPVTAN